MKLQFEHFRRQKILKLELSSTFSFLLATLTTPYPVTLAPEVLEMMEVNHYWIRDEYKDD